MGQKTILLMADAPDSYIKGLVEAILAFGGWEIIFCPAYPVNLTVSHWYKDRAIAVEPLFYGNDEEWCALSYFKRMRLCASRAKEIARRYHPNIINIQQISPPRMFVALSRCFRDSELILSFWGSDLLRQKNQLYLRVLYPMALRRAETITFDSMNMTNRLHLLYGSKYDHKVQLVRFFNHNIDNICTLKKQHTRDELRQKLDLPTDGRIILTVGYNRNPAHNQLQVTRTIGSLPKSVQEKLFIVYPMTYGPKDESYHDQLQAEMRALFCNYRILSDYLTDWDCACLYLSVDGFIHAQISDAYSQTFVNYIYAGATVFQADWLHYPEIDQYGLRLYEFSDYQQLTQQLEAYINDFPHKSIAQSPAALEILQKNESTTIINEKMKNILEGEQDVSNPSV